MIVLRKVRPNSPSVVVGEILQGNQNGVNRTFNTANNFISGKILITYNGQTLQKDFDFEELSTSSIRLLHFAPQSDDVLLTATYEVAS